MNKESKKYNILYAEDDNLTRKYYGDFLKIYFKDVYVAKDGKEAWELYSKHTIDIMLLDINMPYLTGLEVASKVRQKDRDTKIIILTAFIDEKNLLVAVELHLLKYLHKPVKREILKKTLDKAIFELENDYISDNLFYIPEDYIWDKFKKSLTRYEKNIALTKNETILMELLSSEYEKSFTTQNIIDFFWTHEKNIDLNLNGFKGL
ncbi:MAG: response regulator, partial [Sulfurimonas sp.]|nr:response regulator [Sulfurimonas sp.]